MSVLVRHREGFSELVGLIYEAARDPALIETMLTHVADHLGASGGMVVRNDLRPGRTWMRVGRLDPELSRLYIQHYVDNPYTRGIANEAGRQVLLASQVVPAARIRPTALHADILAPQGIGDMVVCQYAPWRSQGVSGGVSFTILEGEAEHTDRLLRRFRRLAPHLTRALDLGSMLAARAASSEPLRVAIDAAPTAALLLNLEGRILHWNRAAQAILDQADGLVLGRRSSPAALLATVPSSDRQLSALLARCCLGLRGGAVGPDGTMRVLRPSGQPPYGLCAIPLPCAAPAFAGPDAPGLLLFLTASDTPVPGHAAPLLRTLFGLTPAEARVAVQIAIGAGIGPASEALGLSAETVRRHLSQCFTKLGVNTQAGLARLAASLPALPEQRRRE